jgi:predicted lipoprotein with Yx(FWY)xxD motif
MKFFNHIHLQENHMKIISIHRRLLCAAVAFGSFIALPVSAGYYTSAGPYAPGYNTQAYGYKYYGAPRYGERAFNLYRRPGPGYYSQRPNRYGRPIYTAPYAAGPTTGNSTVPRDNKNTTNSTQSSPVDIELPTSGDIKLTKKGVAHILTDASGMSLYTYTQDQNNQSSCSGQCAISWPPVAAKSESAAVGDFTPVQRSDGSLQWAYKGQPLYRWVGDRMAGDTSGDGVGGVWNLARI